RLSSKKRWAIPGRCGLIVRIPARGGKSAARLRGRERRRSRTYRAMGYTTAAVLKITRRSCDLQSFYGRAWRRAPVSAALAPADDQVDLAALGATAAGGRPLRDHAVSLDRRRIGSADPAE